MDFVTNLPVCGGGYSAIFTCVDRMTKFTRLTPCILGAGELSAAHVARLFFDSVVRLFGVPEDVVHDRDPRFTSDFWRCLWELMGTKVVLSSAYHPQTDGQTERTHRTLEQALMCLLVERSRPESDWCELLGVVEFGINSTVAASTGKSPAELVYGETLRAPLDAVVGVPARSDADADDLAARVKTLVAAARNQLERA